MLQDGGGGEMSFKEEARSTLTKPHKYIHSLESSFLMLKENGGNYSLKTLSFPSNLVSAETYTRGRREFISFVYFF